MESRTKGQQDKRTEGQKDKVYLQLKIFKISLKCCLAS